MDRQLGLVPIKAQPLMMAFAQRYALAVWNSSGPVSFANWVVRVRWAGLLKAERYTDAARPLFHFALVPLVILPCGRCFVRYALLRLGLDRLALGL